jgi:hypothetical protein
MEGTSGPLKGGEILEQLSYYQLLLSRTLLHGVNFGSVQLTGHISHITMINGLIYKSMIILSILE